MQHMSTLHTLTALAVRVMPKAAAAGERPDRCTRAVYQASKWKAIALENAALLTNRAFCHKKRSDWLKVMEDSRAALKLDSDCMKVLACCCIMSVHAHPVRTWRRVHHWMITGAQQSGHHLA